VQALESIKVFSKHKDFSMLHFGHKRLMHFGYANGFSRLCHTFFGWVLLYDVSHISDLPLPKDT
jgi:hypothetical protein